MDRTLNPAKRRASTARRMRRLRARRKAAKELAEHTAQVANVAARRKAGRIRSARYRARVAERHAVEQNAILPEE